MEVGPYRVKDKDTLALNNGSWNEFANLLFVDNPVGTGFSYVDTDSYIEELDTMADQFVLFLDKFFALFPEYDRDDVSTHEFEIESQLLTRSRFTLLESPMPGSISPTLPGKSWTTTRPSQKTNGI